MLTSLRTRLQKDEDGFTLIELMVVVLIIAILLAIAIPTFLGAQDRARDRGAQSDLRNALTAAKTIATDDAGQYDTVTVAALQDAEGSLTFVSGMGDTDDVGVLPAAAVPEYILFSKASESGQVFGIATNAAGQVGYCDGASGTVFAITDADTLAGCNNPEW